MVTLPDKKEGRYFIEYYSGDGTHKLAIDGKENQWMISSGNDCRIKDDNGYAESHNIADNDLFTVETAGEECIVLSEPVIQRRCMYKKLFLKNADSEISIGQKKDNTITISNPYVSGRHAILSRRGGVWSVEDMESRNGTFVNNRRIKNTVLSAGDAVSILGYKFIIGSDFIAANIYDDAVRYDANCFFEKPAFVPSAVRPSTDNKAEKKYFYRTLKLNEKKLTEKKITLEAPPMKEAKKNDSVLLKLGPSFTMCTGSVLTAGYSVLAAYYRDTNMSYVVPSIIMAGTMMLSAMLWPSILTKSQRKHEKKKNQERLEMYSGYISNARSEIERIKNDECDIMNEINYLSDRCAGLAVGNGIVPDKYLWCRHISDEDFMKVCIGKGDTDALIDIKYPEKSLASMNDTVSENLYQLVSEERKLKNVNIPLSLKEGCLCGCTGDKTAAEEFIRALVVQLTALYSYDELKLVFIYNSIDEDVWNYVRWLPHVWDESNTFRFVASSSEDIKELSVQLEKEVTERAEERETKRPYYLIITADRELTEQMTPVQQILKCYKEIRFSMITLFYQRNYLESDIIFDFESRDKACMFQRIRPGNTKGDKEKEKQSTAETKDIVQQFVPDRIDDRLFNNYINSISNIKLDLSSERNKLPKMVTFLEMFKVSKPEHLNCLTRWSENNPSKSLQTPIGVNQAGDSFYIDLHEKYHGPHGLIAGTTGSGKSESIITFILSIAVNFSPEEAAFLIIDYKGGGLADAFESIERTVENGREVERTVKLPHLVGTLTNLDVATIERSRISIESELKRRQSMFKVARKVSGEGTMDIYKYQELRRNGTDLEALPHLFIVCDEFAELKTQQPEFMDSLVSTARIGRSLGVHLILATQKPDSVVSPQIWSNSRFKICLKVQDKADSTAVIHCPDAAEIKTTGRFYLQVGYNEQFSLGQSAWCGADYTGVDRNNAEKEKSAELIGSTGTVICEKTIKNRSKAKGEHTVSELVAVRQYLIDIARDIKVRPLWLLPLPSFINIDNLYSEYSGEHDKYSIEPVIGKWDDLYERKQEIMTLPFSSKGNVCVYGVQGSGSDMFFITLIYSLISRYTADRVNICILDFDSGYLKVFEKAPQVSSVVLADENELVKQFIAELKAEIISRNRMFAPYGGEYSEYCRFSGKTMPNIVLILNNYSLFSEEYEDILFDLAYITREGAKVGIYVVIGSQSINVHSRIKQNIGQHLMLRMNDKLDYSAVLGRTEGIIPSDCKGRGLVRYGAHVYEFQTADILPFDPNAEDSTFTEADADPTGIINELCRKAASGAGSTAAKQFVKRFEQFDTSKLLDMAGSIEAVPLGQMADSTDIWTEDMKNVYITFVSSKSEKMLSDYAAYISGVLAADSSAEVILIDTNSSVDPPSDAKYKYKDGSELEEWQAAFQQMYVERDQALIEGEDKSLRMPDDVGDLYIVVNGFRALADKSMLCMARFVEAMLYCDIHKIHYVVLDTPEEMHDPCGCYERIIVSGDQQIDVLSFDNAHDEWFSELGIWLGGGFTSQNLFEVSNADDANSTDQTAVVVKNGRVCSNLINIAGEQNG